MHSQAESMKVYSRFVNKCVGLSDPLTSPVSTPIAFLRIAAFTCIGFSYDQAINALKIALADAVFAKKIEEIHARKPRRMPSLQDLLITPIQRLPRYLLMLKVTTTSSLSFDQVI